MATIKVFNDGNEIKVENATCYNCTLHKSHRGGFCNGSKQVCSQIYYNYRQ